MLLFLTRQYYISKFPIGLFEVINHCYNGTNFYLQNIDKLDDSDYISIKYEELCDNPNDIIVDIMKFLNLKSDFDYSNYIKPRKIKLNKNVKLLSNYINKKMKTYFNYFDYKLESDN